jgi:hypothetical protein
MPADAGKSAYNAPMKYSLRSLLIAGAVLPPLLAVTVWLWRESDLSFGELTAITALWFVGGYFFIYYLSKSS